MLSGISIAETLIDREWSGLELDPEVDDLFKQELHRLELENSSSSNWSQMFLHSRQNLFVFDILRIGYSFTKLKEIHPDIFSEALARTSIRIEQAAAEWKSFAQEKYLSKGLVIPDYPQFVQIQEALGLYGRSKLERALRRIKSSIRKQWYVIFDRYKTGTGEKVSN
jgi:hypothetical protein